MIKYRRNITWLSIALWLAILVRSTPAAAITISEEEKLSEKFMHEVTRHFTFIEDPVLVNYLRTMGKRIIGVLPPQPYKFRFFLIKDNAYNAFAGPGGVIFVNSGLLAAMENPDELAGILAHEITHVLSRHISDRIDRSKQIGIATLAGLVAAIALGAAGEGSVASAMLMGSMATGQSMALAYSREDEMQADQLGLKILTKAGYHPVGLVSMMNKIRQKAWYDTNQIPTYLRTHPASEERIVYISAWIERQKDLPEPLSNKELTDFNWIRTRIKALYGEREQMLAYFSDDVKKRPADPLAHYGYGLILARSGRFKEAAAHLKKTLARRAFDAQLLVDLGRVYFLDGRFSEALGTLEGAVAIDPGNPDGLFYLGRTRLSLKKTSEALAAFEDLLRINSNHRDLMYFAGQAYGQQGNMEEAHYYLGRYFYNQGKIKPAIVQFKKAMDLAAKAARKSEIEALLKELRAERTRQLKSDD
ncbi:MAG: M48 family metalloprotease [Thermodesulfobacteriota bacterium]|nr:M48 family metalloprotease [Thermodesulfobacteriota bacterium]